MTGNQSKARAKRGFRRGQSVEMPSSSSSSSAPKKGSPTRKRRVFGRSASTASDVPDAPLSSPSGGGSGSGGVRHVDVSPAGSTKPAHFNQETESQMEAIDGTDMGTETETMPVKYIPSPDPGQSSIEVRSSRKGASRRQSV